MNDELTAYIRALEARIKALEGQPASSKANAPKTEGWVKLAVFFTATLVLLAFNFGPSAVNVLWGEGTVSQVSEASIASQAGQVFVSWSTILGLVFGAAVMNKQPNDRSIENNSRGSREE